MTALLKTPLSQWHQAHGAKMAEFAGYDMPIQYAGILAEHEHTRSAASVFDICHMGEFTISGKGAAEALSKAVTHNLETLKVGKCRYGFLLNEQANIIDDLIVYRMGDDEFMLVVNGACAEKDFAALKERMPAGVELKDISANVAKIDLQGPSSLQVLEAFFSKSFTHLGYFSFEEHAYGAYKILVSRTGYTGELGYELYLPWENALDLWEKLLQDERVKPAGLGARDTLRLEAGLPLYGHDLDDAHNPTEAGMGRMLTSTAAYVGHEHVGEIREQLVALRIEGRRAARHGDVLALSDGHEVGRVTSGSYAPSLGYVVALAWVDAKHANVKEFVVQAARASLQASVVELPFYTKGTARIKLS